MKLRGLLLRIKSSSLFHRILKLIEEAMPVGIASRSKGLNTIIKIDKMTNQNLITYKKIENVFCLLLIPITLLNFLKYKTQVCIEAVKKTLITFRSNQIQPSRFRPNVLLRENLTIHR